MLMDITSIVLYIEKEDRRRKSFFFSFLLFFCAANKSFLSAAFLAKEAIEFSCAKATKKWSFQAILFKSNPSLESYFQGNIQFVKVGRRGTYKKSNKNSFFFLYFNLLYLASCRVRSRRSRYDVRAEHTIAKPTFVVVSARFRFRTSRL